MSQVKDATLRVRKRDGRFENYQRRKIEQVVKLCLVNGCGKPDDEDTGRMVDQVASQVEQTLARAGIQTIDVEGVQDIV